MSVRSATPVIVVVVVLQPDRRAHITARIRRDEGKLVVAKHAGAAIDPATQQFVGRIVPEIAVLGRGGSGAQLRQTQRGRGDKRAAARRRGAQHGPERLPIGGNGDAEIVVTTQADLGATGITRLENLRRDIRRGALVQFDA
jgi:hypothetical protein